MDIGCGWGGFMIYAAQHYGVEVVGISLSQEQTKLARERIYEASCVLLEKMLLAALLHCL